MAAAWRGPTEFPGAKLLCSVGPRSAGAEKVKSRGLKRADGESDGSEEQGCSDEADGKNPLVVIGGTSAEGALEQNGPEPARGVDDVGGGGMAEETDHKNQKDFVSDCTNLARDTNLHVHLVHHVRKGQTDEAMPQKVDMKGSGSIADQVDNVFMMWRNKKKERLQEAGQPTDIDEPDAMLLCEKQRNGEFEPRLRLWYDRRSQQFLEKAGANPYRFDSDF